jgi:hypothetical protein
MQASVSPAGSGGTGTRPRPHQDHEYRNQRMLGVLDANNLLRSRYLAYAESTWKRHAAAIRSLNKFSLERHINIFKCKDTYRKTPMFGQLP